MESGSRAPADVREATLGDRPSDNEVVQVVDATPGVRFVDFHRFTWWRTTPPASTGQLAAD